MEKGCCVCQGRGSAHKGRGRKQADQDQLRDCAFGIPGIGAYDWLGSNNAISGDLPVDMIGALGVVFCGWERRDSMSHMREEGGGMGQTQTQHLGVNGGGRRGKLGERMKP